MPLPLTVSCFSKIQIGFTFLVPAHPGSPGKRAVKRVCVCVSNSRRQLVGSWVTNMSSDTHTITIMCSRTDWKTLRLAIHKQAYIIRLQAYGLLLEPRPSHLAVAAPSGWLVFCVTLTSLHMAHVQMSHHP